MIREIKEKISLCDFIKWCKIKKTIIFSGKSVTISYLCSLIQKNKTELLTFYYHKLLNKNIIIVLKFSLS